MATYFARKAGNINAADVWATTPSGTAAAVTFASGDVLVSNSFAIAINVDINLGGAGQVRNDTLGGATTGGTFTLAAGVTLTANVLQNNTTGGATVVLFSAGATNVAYIVGNVISPVNTSGGNSPINILGSGTLYFTGNATGDVKSSTATGAITLSSGGSTLIFTGNATGGGGVGGYAIYNSFGGTVTIIGNCYGATAPAVGNGGTSVVTINGQAIGSTTTGGGAGVANTSTGSVFATRAVGGSFGPGSSGVSAAPGITNSSTGIVQIEQLEYGTNGMSPTSGGGIRLKKASSNVAIFNYCDTVGSKTLVDATQGQMPAATDVRNGVSYASGALTGSAYIPSASSVASGVPVGSTTGTAVLTAAAIRAELAVELARIDADISSRLAPSGTLATVTTLTNAPTVPTAAAIATQVRTELATELARVDAAVSTRLATSAYTAPSTAPTAAANASAVRTELATELARVDVATSTRLAGSAYTAPANSDVTAIKAKTDLLETTRLAQCSTVATTGAQLAAALS
jgi:hypothetical protein